MGRTSIVRVAHSMLTALSRSAAEGRKKDLKISDRIQPGAEGGPILMRDHDSRGHAFIF